MHKRRLHKRQARDAQLHLLFARAGPAPLPAGASPDRLPSFLRGEDPDPSTASLPPLDLDWNSLPEGTDPSSGDLDEGRSFRKRQQLASMLAHVAAFLEGEEQQEDEDEKEDTEGASPAAVPGRQKLTVVDVGAGTGHLGLLVAHLWPERCRVILLERKEWTSTTSAERCVDLPTHHVPIPFNTSCCAGSSAW